MNRQFIIVICCIFYGCASTNQLAEKSTAIDNYIKKYPSAPDGQAEYLLSDSFRSKYKTLLTCLVNDSDYYYSEQKHLPYFQINIFAVNSSGLTKRCEKELGIPLVPMEVRYTTNDLFQYYNDIDKILKISKISYQAEFPKYENIIDILVLESDFQRAKRALETLPKDAFQIIVVKEFKDIIVETKY